MVFSSTTFLFLFLPLVFLGYCLVGQKLRNLVLLVASLFFYWWGENIYVFLMIASIGSNYLFGMLIARAQQLQKSGKAALIGAICINLGLLALFKYANFFVDTINIILKQLSIPPIFLEPVHLPIGISFFTFQALSYVIDVYRKESPVQKNPLNIALYISLFPQLIAGPIIRYHDVAKALSSRTTTMEDLLYGIKRFIVGLAKKVLIANVLGKTADYIFSLPADTIFCSLAWLGAISYTLQIYFDFSGYSDMAIGLGRIFGFHFPENFNYPYISRSIQEFWRRWHISLSTWFRDYLYIPLGGNRISPERTYFNLVVVFFLCGLWHGASWTFVFWGLFHGLFLIIERTRFGKKVLEAVPAAIQHLYCLLVVIVGWVFFRSESFGYAIGYLYAMVDVTREPFLNTQLFLRMNNNYYFTLILGILGSMPLFPKIAGMKWLKRPENEPIFSMQGMLIGNMQLLFFGFILVYSLASVIGNLYNPFLYFRF